MFDYTVKKQSVIFQIPLSSYLGKHRYSVYNQDTKQWERKEKWPESLQDYKESIFGYFDFPYLPFSELYDTQDMKEQAADYLKKKIKASSEELSLFDSDIEQAIASAATDAYRQSYLDEWLEKYRDELASQLTNDFTDIPGRLLDDPSHNDYMKERAEADHIRLEISKADIKKWLKDNYPNDDYHRQPDYIDYFHDYALDVSICEVDTEYIDKYGQLGDYDQWLGYFKDYQGPELINTIEAHRKQKQAKIDNNQLMQENTTKHLAAITDYNDKYIKAKDKHEKIARQISALASIIKKA